MAMFRTEAPWGVKLLNGPLSTFSDFITLDVVLVLVAVTVAVAPPLSLSVKMKSSKVDLCVPNPIEATEAAVAAIAPPRATDRILDSASDCLVLEVTATCMGTVADTADAATDAAADENVMLRVLVVTISRICRRFPFNVLTKNVLQSDRIGQDRLKQLLYSMLVAKGE